MLFRKGLVVLLCLLPLSVYAQQALKSESVQEEKGQKAAADPGKISLKLKNMDVIEVFNILSQKGKLNIVAGNDVRGRITLFVDNVDIWTAFRLVAETSNLAYVKEGDVIRVFTDREYEILFGQRFYDKTQVKVFPLTQAKAETLKSTIDGLKSRIGKVFIDENSNSIIVIDSPVVLEQIETTVKALDVPLRTEIYDLLHADPKAMEEKLKPFLSKRGSIQIDLTTSKVIITDVPSTFEVLARLIKEYDSSPYVKTEIFNLKYAKFDQIKEKLEKELSEGIGFMRADERTNKIAITDVPEKLIRMTKIIEAFDERHREVLIEAQIIQVRLNNSFKFGINWEYIATAISNHAVNLNFSSGFGLLSELPQADSAPVPAFNQRIPTRVQPFDKRTGTNPGARLVIGGLAPGGIDGLGNPYQGVLDMLKTTGDINILSSPRITVLNNEEAKIQVGTNQAYVTNTVVQSTSSSTNAENVNFIQVGVLLKVKPLINEDGIITMEIEPEVSSVASFLETSAGNKIPIVRTSNAKTRVMVKDGVTIVIGGLIDRQISKNVSKVPILGSIPIIGIPFKKIDDSIDNAELVIFLTPHIMNGDITTEEKDKYNEQLKLPKKEQPEFVDDVRHFLNAK